MSETLRALEEGLREFGEHLSRVPGGEPARLADSFLQSLEFLMLTAAEAVATADQGDIARLVTMTRGSGAATESFSKRYFDAREVLTGGEFDYLFNLANLFARLVYYLRGLAEMLASTSENARGATA